MTANIYNNKWLQQFEPILIYFEKHVIHGNE